MTMQTPSISPLRMLSVYVALGGIVSYVLNMVFGGRVFALLALSSPDVLERFEFWRLISYPFALQSEANLIVMALSLFVLAPILEREFTRPRWALLITTLTIFWGLFHVFLFYGQTVRLYGAELLAFFVMTLTTWLYPYQTVRLVGAITTRAVVVALPLAFFSVSLALVAAVFGNKGVVLHGAFSTAVGVITGIAVGYGVRRIATARIPLRQVHTPANSLLPILDNTPKAMASPTKWSLPQMSKQSADLLSEYDSVEEDYTDEGRLNSILDKINETGVASLSPEERHFLEMYSQTMKY